jgi:hypothetical protein
VTDRALDKHDHEAAGQLIKPVEQAEELAGIGNHEAAIARAAVIDARLAVARARE